jgi:deoxyribose-phosphate aldolase
MSLAQMEALETSSNDLFANAGKSKFNKTSTGFSTQDITLSEFLNKNF